MVRRIEAGMQGDWPVIVRTAVMDEIILRLVRRGVRRVVNLAAGLDARPWRLQLPATLRWIDVDLPAVLRHKRRTLSGESPRCDYEEISADLARNTERRKLYRSIDTESGETLVLTEGLLVYLHPLTVGALARELHRACRWWLTDLASRDLRSIAASQGTGAALRFAPANAPAWFGAHGWREKEFHSTVHEAARLRRAPELETFWNQLPPAKGASRKERIHRFSGVALFSRA